MKITIQCLVHQVVDQYGPVDAPPKFAAHACDMSQFDGYVLIGPAQFEFEVPDSFNPTHAQVASLEQKLDKLADDYHCAAAMIRDRISKLQCIENSPAAPQ